jgi:hypothetical protein
MHGHVNIELVYFFEPFSSAVFKTWSRFASVKLIRITENYWLFENCGDNSPFTRVYKLFVLDSLAYSLY